MRVRQVLVKLILPLGLVLVLGVLLMKWDHIFVGPGISYADVLGADSPSAAQAPALSHNSAASKNIGTGALNLVSTCSQTGSSIFHDTYDPFGTDVTPGNLGSEAPDRDPQTRPAHVVQYPGASETGADAKAQAAPNFLPMPTPILRFLGLDYRVETPTPRVPDMNGDVGLTHFVQVVNGGIGVWNKNDGTSVTSFRLRDLWARPDGESMCEGYHTDPVVLYDAIADRWLISDIAMDGLTNGINQCVAVSATSDPLGSYHRYQFRPIGTDRYLDYSKFGVWTNAYYMSTVEFNSSEEALGASAIALQRDAMLHGRQAAYQRCRISNEPGQTAPVTLLPTDMEVANFDKNTLPPEGAPYVFASLGYDHDPAANYDTLYLYYFTPRWNNPTGATMVGDLLDTAYPFKPELCGNQPPNRLCVPQPRVTTTPGPSARLDSMGDRLMHRLVYRRLGNEQRWLMNHTVDLADKYYRSGIRWRELTGNTMGNLSIRQESTLSRPDSLWRWNGSIAMDHSGNIALGYNAASENLSASVYYTGRLAGDTLTEMRQEIALAPGNGVRTDPDGRWGDYSMMAVDPVDDCTFWHTNEYMLNISPYNWNTTIGKFKFAECQPATCATQFADVQPENTFYSFIRCLACKGFISGYADGNFRYGWDVTRAQLSKIIANSAFFSDQPLPGTQTFEDVPPTHPFYIWIEQIKRRQFVEGYPCGSPGEPCRSGNRPYFRPYANATRAQIAKITYLANAASFTQPIGTQIFQDVPTTHAFYNYIQKLTRHGIVTGYPCGGVGEPCLAGNRPYFRPNNNVTRGQMAKIAAKTFFPNSNCGTTTALQDAPDVQNPPGPKLPQPPGPVSTIPAPVPSTEPTLEPTNTPANTPTNTPTPCPGCGNFADVQPGTEFYPYVSCLNCNNVIGGYECGSLPEEPCDACNTPYYRPDTLMVRGQLAKIVSNAAGYAETPSGQQYEDVPPSNPYYQWVYRITVHGVIGGYQCGGPNEPCGQNNLAYFRPYTNATRSQVAKAVSNASGYNETPTTQTFEDIAPGSTFYLWVERLATRNIMNGYPCGGAGEPCISGRAYFRPYSEATRGQASKATSRSFFPSCNPGLKPGKPNAVLSATVPPQTTATQAAPSATISVPVPTNTALQIPSPWPTAPLPIPTRYVPTIPPVGTAAPPTVPVGTSIPTITIPIP